MWVFMGAEAPPVEPKGCDLSRCPVTFPGEDGPGTHHAAEQGAEVEAQDAVKVSAETHTPKKTTVDVGICFI